MKRIPTLIAGGSAALLTVSVALFAGPQDDPPPGGAEPVRTVESSRSAVEMLLDEVALLSEEINILRRQLAEARMAASAAEEELAELRQFISDHHEFGDDFGQYRGVKAIAEREARQRRTDELRERREAHRAERAARQAEQRAGRSRENAEAERRSRFRDAGFAHIGLDVMTSRMGYSYQTREEHAVRVDYDPLIGRYLRPLGANVDLDFSSMTISGSVVNASDEVRNIGIAITFFDEYGNQVGGEIIQVNNARPDVPYPFTSTVDMALNRPFNSSSIYVLYADPIADTGS